MQTQAKAENMTTHNVYKNNRLKVLNDVLSMFNLGFLGVEKNFSTKMIITYQEGERLRANCRTEKEYNKNHSAKRIVLEHVMPSEGIKKYRIVNTC